MTTSNPTAESTDRIEKQFHVNAPVSRVWRAVSNHEEFGAWFRMTIDRPFATGASVLGRITIPGYEHVTVEMRVERIEPENYFSYRWHPYAVDPAIDYSAEPMTLVEFRLEAAQGGTSVTIVESGFDRLPSDRRAEAFRMNQGGWDGQARNLAAHVG